MIAKTCASCPAHGLALIYSFSCSAQCPLGPCGADGFLLASAMTCTAADLTSVAKAAMSFMERMSATNPVVPSAPSPPDDSHRGRSTSEWQQERQHSSSDASVSLPSQKTLPDDSPHLRERKSGGELSISNDIKERGSTTKISTVVADLVAAVQYPPGSLPYLVMLQTWPS